MTIMTSQDKSTNNITERPMHEIASEHRQTIGTTET